MKKIALTITAALFLIGCGKGEGKPESKSSGEESASIKEPHDESGNPSAAKVPKIPPNTPEKKPKTRTIPTRIPLRTIPTKKTEEQGDKNSTVTTNPGEALVGSWMYTQDGFVFTIFLEKDGKGKVRIEEGDQKADFTMSWEADDNKLTLTGNDPKTHEKDIDEGTYKLTDGFLEYELEGEKFTLIQVKE